MLESLSGEGLSHACLSQLIDPEPGEESGAPVPPPIVV